VFCQDSQKGSARVRLLCKASTESVFENVCLAQALDIVYPTFCKDCALMPFLCQGSEAGTFENLCLAQEPELEVGGRFHHVAAGGFQLARENAELWHAQNCQKSPICMAKATCSYGKRDLFIWQKRPIHMAKETCS